MYILYRWSQTLHASIHISKTVYLISDVNVFGTYDRVSVLALTSGLMHSTRKKKLRKCKQLKRYISTNGCYLKINWKDKSKDQYVTNLLMSVFLCNVMVSEIIMRCLSEVRLRTWKEFPTFSLLMCKSQKFFF